VKNLGIVLSQYADNAALQVGVQCHNCLEISVLWYIGVEPLERDEGHDIEAVVGGLGLQVCRQYA
jgi:hypothetical protein